MTQGRLRLVLWGCKRAVERSAQVGQHRAQLGVDTLAIRLGQRLVGAQHQHAREQALDHLFVDLAGQRDAFREPPSALLLARGPLDVRRERRQAPERQHPLLFGGAELEPPASAIGEDHPEPAAPGGDRRAGDRGDAGEARVSRRDVARVIVGGLDDSVLGEGALRHRRLVQGALDLRHELRVGAVRADGHDRLVSAVVEEQRCTPERGEAAERLADVVVELAGLCRRVELGEQADDYVDRLRARRCADHLDDEATRVGPSGYPWPFAAHDPG
jgi:hypothetical protein